MLILFLLIFFIFYIQFGLLVVFQLIIWTLVFFGSNFIIGINPDNLKFQVIRIISIISILAILYVNFKNEIDLVSFAALNIRSYSIPTIHPYSMFKITFINEINDKINIQEGEEYYIFRKWNDNYIKVFLDSLDESIYAINFEYIPDFHGYVVAPTNPKLLLCNPIVITKILILE